MDYAEFYYINILGCYPHETEKEKLITKATIDYLLDSGFSEPEVVKAIETSKPSDCLTPDALPDWIWEGSLIKRNTYYYHHILHITPAAPIFDIFTKTEKTTGFYMEIRPRFTMEQLVNYFYNTLIINSELADSKRDAGSFGYLLDKYSKFRFIQPLDFVLALIDIANIDKNQTVVVANILDIAHHEALVHANLKQMTAHAEFYKTNRIIWRSEQWTDL